MTLTQVDIMYQTPRGPGDLRSNVGAQDDKTRKHLPERTAQHRSISCSKNKQTAGNSRSLVMYI